jgi:hypothetical protein
MRDQRSRLMINSLRCDERRNKSYESCALRLSVGVDVATVVRDNFRARCLPANARPIVRLVCLNLMWASYLQKALPIHVFEEIGVGPWQFAKDQLGCVGFCVQHAQVESTLELKTGKRIDRKTCVMPCKATGWR